MITIRRNFNSRFGHIKNMLLSNETCGDLITVVEGFAGELMEVDAKLGALVDVVYALVNDRR